MKAPSSVWIVMSLASICGCIPLAANDNYSLNNHWELLGDFVFMRRSEIHDKTLVKNSKKKQNPCKCPDYTAISTSDLVNDFDFEPGYRVGLTYIVNDKMGFEWNFLYLQPWHAKEKAHGNQSLSFPFSHSNYTHDFHKASEAIAKYGSHFWDLEFNYWNYFTPRRVEYFSLSGIAGMRYFHWDEWFKLQLVRPPDKSNYNVHTENRIFGVQLGLDLQMNPTHWLSWEFFAKVGGMVDHSEQKTFLGDLNNQVTLRDFKKQQWQIGIYTDVLAEFAIHCNRHLNLHAGYQVMFFSGLALAPEQLSKKTTKHAGERDYDDGTAIIHGMFIGVILGF